MMKATALLFVPCALVALLVAAFPGRGDPSGNRAPGRFARGDGCTLVAASTHPASWRADPTVSAMRRLIDRHPGAWPGAAAWSCPGGRLEWR